MLDKISEDKLKLILEKIDTYGLQNEDSDADIVDQILNTEEYKTFLKYENPVDDTNIYDKKSSVLEHYLKSRKHKQ
jgi:hypothetical protein